MTGSGRRDQDAAHARLLWLLAQRAPEGQPARGAGGDARDQEVQALAEQLGLAPEEVDAITPAMVEASARPPELVGRFRIYRQARTVVPFLCGLILVPIVAQLGQPLLAAGGLVLLVAAWVVRGRISVARFGIDPYGRLATRRHGMIEWYEVDELTFRYCRPWLVPRHRLESIAGTTALVRIRRRGGIVRLARGQLFRTRPDRRPVHLADLARFLRRQATAAGMRVEKLGDDGQWRAHRGHA